MASQSAIDLNYVVLPSGTESNQVLQARLPHHEDIAVFFDLSHVLRRLEEFQAQFPSVSAYFPTDSNDHPRLLKELGALHGADKLAGFICNSRSHLETVLGVNTPVDADAVIYGHAVVRTSVLVRARELGVTQVAVSSLAELESVAVHHPTADLVVRLRSTTDGQQLLDAAAQRAVKVAGILLDLGADVTTADFLRGVERVAALATAVQSLSIVNLGEGITAANAAEVAPAIAQLRAALPAAVKLSAAPGRFLVEAAQLVGFQLADVANGAILADGLANAAPFLSASSLTCTAANATSFSVAKLSGSASSSSLSVSLPASVQAGSWVVVPNTGAYTTEILRFTDPEAVFFYKSAQLSSSAAAASSSSSSSSTAAVSIIFEGIAVDRLLGRDETFNRQRHLDMIAAQGTKSAASSASDLELSYTLPSGISVHIAPLSTFTEVPEGARDLLGRVAASISLPAGVEFQPAQLEFVEPLLYRLIGWLHPDSIYFTLSGTGTEAQQLLSSPAKRLAVFPWLSPKIFAARVSPSLSATESSWTFKHAVHYDSQRRDAIWAMENLEDCAAGAEKYAYGVAVRRVLFETRSVFQHIVFFDSTQFGRCMMLDGHLQYTEHDECAYQEMLCHLPLCSHPEPKRVMIVGGGDLFCAREVLRYENVAEVVNVEIDTMVTQMCSWFIPDTYEVKHNQPRFTLVHQDAALWVDAHKDQQFDVIIVDSSDPTEESPAKVLYQQPFLLNLFDMLSPEGILSYQGETFWDYAGFILKFMNTLRAVFPEVRHATGQIPTYPNGQMGYTIARKSPRQDPNVGLETPRRAPPSTGLKFYTPELHKASFALPLFIDEQLYPKSE